MPTCDAEPSSLKGLKTYKGSRPGTVKVGKMMLDDLERPIARQSGLLQLLINIINVRSSQWNKISRSKQFH